MRPTLTVYFAAALLLAATGRAWAGQTQDLQLRLETALASYSRPGTAFVARVQGAANGAAASILPRGTLVRGSVRKAHSVGLGLRRERAGLVLEFSGCELPGGEAAACAVRLLAVDNARETVRTDNRIQGVLAASYPPRFLNGLWYRPAAPVFLRPVSGLAGATGMISKRLVPGPVGAAIFLTSRLAFFRIPDPEIELPTGTGLIARIETETALPESDAPALPASPAALLPEAWLAGIERDLTRGDGTTPVADRINMVFLASPEQLSQAFQAAGWQTAEALTVKTFAKTYSAFVGMKSYPNAPVSAVYYQGRPPDLVFQRSFNTLARRHHIRLWKAESPDGGILWLGAATHDVGLVFDWNHMNLTHRIDPEIDRERGKVANDLAAVECVDREELLAGPEYESRTAEPITDGGLWVGVLSGCRSAAASPVSVPRLKRSRVVLSLRRVVLESRYYLLRANAYHFSYESARWLFFGHRPAKNRQYAMALK